MGEGEWSGGQGEEGIPYKGGTYAKAWQPEKVGGVLGPRDRSATLPHPVSQCAQTLRRMSHWLVWQQNPSAPYRGSLQTEKSLDPHP